jgi:hypothetical protein
MVSIITLICNHLEDATRPCRLRRIVGSIFGASGR